MHSRERHHEHTCRKSYSAINCDKCVIKKGTLRFPSVLTYVNYKLFTISSTDFLASPKHM